MTAQPSPARRLARFGVFELNLRTGELRRNGLKVHLAEQPLQALVVLLENSGELVTREQLRDRLWPEGTFVDFEHSLNAAVKKLRDALGDSAENPRFIETLARRGYRFLAPVEWIEDKPARWPKWPLAVAVLALVTGYAIWRLTPPRGPANTSAPDMKVVPLTSYPGAEISPTFSPDGRQVAFAWNGEREDNYDIYVKQIGPGSPVRLTTDPAPDLNPSWSPDGKWIAFRREHGSTSDILLIPSLGGRPERKLGVVVLVLQTEGFAFGGDVSWSPDGRFLAVADSGGIVLVSVETADQRRLALGANIQGGASPRFSPDGRAFAFHGYPDSGGSAIYLQRLTAEYEPDGEAILLASMALLTGLDWSPDGRSIIYSDFGNLWRIPAGGGTSERLSAVTEPAFAPVIARQGNRLAFVRRAADLNLYRLLLPENKARPGPPVRFASSTRSELDLHFSPDGRKVAFASDRSGNDEIWVCDSDGSHPYQLTSFNGPVTGSPKWSPDSRQVAFDCSKDGSGDVYLIDVRGGAPRKLTAEPSLDARPSWSSDGKWIYFGSNRTGADQVWKVPATGGGAVQVTRGGGFEAAESSDGNVVYYVKRGSRGIWRVPSNGGNESQVLDRGDEGLWALRGDQIYLISEEPDGSPFLGLYDLASGAFSTLAELPGQTVRFPIGPALTVSPDGRAILYIQIDRLEHDIMIIENFR